MKKIIEASAPINVLNELSIKEKISKGHPGNIHLWWNRSPIDSSSVILKTLLDDFENNKTQITDLISQSIKRDTRIDPPKDVIICDPFSGSGCLAVAAQRIGVKLFSSDLNSVAVLLTKATTEIPSLFSGREPINPDAKGKQYSDAKGLAEDIKYYGGILRKLVFEKLKGYYPDVTTVEGKSYSSYSWIWVRTLKCPNPACGCHIPFATHYSLSKLKDREYWAEPVVHDGKISFVINRGECPKDKETNKHDSRGSMFRCPVCGHLTRNSDVKKIGKAGGFGLQLLAVCSVDENNKKFFVEPDLLHVNAATIPLSLDFVPIGTMPNNTRWFSPPGFGITQYSDLYTPRQLLLMNTLCDFIPSIIKMATSDAIKKGMDCIDDGLVLGGRGAVAYGQAIGVYLSLVISKLSNFNSTICTWDYRSGNIRSAFTRQAIPMTWEFAEGNPFSSVTGNFDAMLQNVYESVLNFSTGAPSNTTQADAVTMEFPINSILFTELPYYDNVGYADLSDYFYIWLRKCLKDVFPQLFEKVVTSKEELTSIPEHFDGDTHKANSSYRNGIFKMLKNFYKVANADYPSLIFFKFSKSDHQALSEQDKNENMSPLEHMLGILVKTGFMITGMWPVMTEKPSSKFDAFRIAIVFRKRNSKGLSTTRRCFINELKHELPSLLNEAYSDSSGIYSHPISGIGKGLSIYTKYESVINADGSVMDIHDALQIIYIDVVGYLDLHSNNTQLEKE